MIKQFDEETFKHKEVTLLFDFCAANEEEMSGLLICTKEHLDEFGEVDEDISPYQFTGTFIEIANTVDGGNYKLKGDDRFIFLDEGYGVWLVGTVDGEEIDFDITDGTELIQALTNAGLVQDKSLAKFF